jgi:hypothetical protein
VGIELAPEPERVALDNAVNYFFANPYAALGERGDEWLRAGRRPVAVEVTWEGTADGIGPVSLEIEHDLAGRPVALTLSRPPSFELVLDIQGGTPLPELPPGLVLRPGEALGASETVRFANSPHRAHRVEGTGDGLPEIVVETLERRGLAVSLDRRPGGLERFRNADGTARLLGFLRIFGLMLLLSAGIAVAAFLLALARRIDLVNGLLLAVPVLGVTLALALSRGTSDFGWVFAVPYFVWIAGFILLAWATGESLLREVRPEAAAAFDALRRRRIGPRVGAAALTGLGFGAAVAGIELGVHLLPTAVSWATPFAGSIPLPLWAPGRTPLEWGASVAALLLAVFAGSLRLAPRRWAWAVAIVPAALLLLAAIPVMRPLPLDLGLKLVTVAALGAAFELGGSLALAVAGLGAYLLPTAAFAALHPAWLGGELAGSGLVLAGVAVLGFVGLSRDASVDAEVAPPSFLRRLEDERRMRYEMALLAEIQRSLLPRETPRLPGWEVEATALLAHEVGGDFYDFFEDDAGALWIAAGDVAGHGSFCSIGHAMTKAALAASIRSGRTPAEVLSEVDRVLRTVEGSRSFTSLALLALDPATGAAALSNAGYPFPLLADGDGTREVAQPALPLGGGPARSYRDVRLTLAPGSALVLYSDGLFEAPDASGEPYGLERPRRVIAARNDGTARELLDALVADWRAAVGRAAPDDTTILVVRRLPVTPAAAAASPGR